MDVHIQYNLAQRALARAFAPVAIVIGCLVVCAQDVSDQQLARLLSDDSTRGGTIANIVSSGRGKIPLLLSWARTPPPELNEIEQNILCISLADIFGQLKTKDAIPFLVKNISLHPWGLTSPNIWMKDAHVIEQRMPAVAALIRIGPEAFDALIHSPREPPTAEDRLAAIFVVSTIASVMKDAKTSEEARTFLGVALAEANLQRFWSEEGLKLLQGSH